MFSVKICGITSAEEAEWVLESGADAVGLNFHAPSPRSVSEPVAREISERIGNRLTVVGVFVNATAETVRHVVTQCGLDLVQLHGNEPPGFSAELQGVQYLRAVRCRDADWERDVLREVRAWTATVPPPDGVLLDAHVPGTFGGTGRALDWPQFARFQRELRGTDSRVPLILAGGLTPENVAEAIRVSEATAVDTASGVESKPGRKDRKKIQAFVQAAREAMKGRVKSEE